MTSRACVSRPTACSIWRRWALTDARGAFLIQHFAISYVSAGRDLAGVSTAAAATPAVIAVSPGATPKSTSAASAGAFRAERLERLDNAELEARELKKWIPRAQLLNEGEATEQRIKQLHHPALLHIVGHGIVLGMRIAEWTHEPGVPARKHGSRCPRHEPVGHRT